MLTTTYNQAHIAPPNPQREFPGVWTMAGSVGRVYKNRSGRWFIRLPGKVQIWCDKQHRTFYSRQHAEWTLAQIQGELDAVYSIPISMPKPERAFPALTFTPLNGSRPAKRKLNGAPSAAIISVMFDTIQRIYSFVFSATGT